MSKDLSDAIGTAIGSAARDAIQNVSKSARKRPRGPSIGPVATGLGLIAAAPLAAKGAGKLKGNLVDAIPGSGLFQSPGNSKGSGKSNGAPGVGKGRRMPVQQDFDIGVPVKTVYNEWTQFERWPEYMHRVIAVSQEDASHLVFTTKIWGRKKEFTAEIVEQRPDQRIKWKSTGGVTHAGVITFHELGPRLTRVELSMDFEPGSMLEKAARGMRYVKRAVRADMARFKAHVLMEDEESRSWRGRIEDGDVKRSTSGRSRSSSASSRSSSSSRSPARRSRGATNGGGSSRGAGSSSGSGSGSSSRRSGSHS